MRAVQNPTAEHDVEHEQEQLRAELRETLDGLAAGIFGPIDWTEQRPLSEGAAAFAELDAGTVAAAKIMLKM